MLSNCLAFAAMLKRQSGKSKARAFGPYGAPSPGLLKSPQGEAMNKADLVRRLKAIRKEIMRTCNLALKRALEVERGSVLRQLRYFDERRG